MDDSMNDGRAKSEVRSTTRRRVAVAAVLAAATMLAVPHLSAVASRDAIASMHAAWIHIAAPGMQFPAGRLNPRVLKIWLASLGVYYLARLNYRFIQIL
jgi:hypothetical protein